MSRFNKVNVPVHVPYASVQRMSREIGALRYADGQVYKDARRINIERTRLAEERRRARQAEREAREAWAEDYAGI